MTERGKYLYGISANSEIGKGNIVMIDRFRWEFEEGPTLIGEISEDGVEETNDIELYDVFSTDEKIKVIVEPGDRWYEFPYEGEERP